MEDGYSAALKEHPDGVLIEVWVVPGASRSSVAGMHGDRVKVRVAAPAESGRANKAVTEVMASALGASSVTLESGFTGRRKRLLARGVSIAEARSRLG